MSFNTLASTLSNSITNKIIVTGDRPTGHLHLGHYVGSLEKRLQLQQDNDMYIIIADTQVMNNDLSKCREVRKNTLEIMRDYLAVGLNPEKVHFFLQSEIPQLFELTNYLSNIVTLPAVLRIPTIKSENQLYNGEKGMTMWFLNYPVSQTADVILFNGEYVPVGIDQLPILEFANDVIDRFHYTFNTSCFTRIKPLLSENCKLTGINGDQKMSKSLNNAIFLSDGATDIEMKVKSMYTDSNHLKISDPGQVEGNVVFKFLDVFHPNQSELQELKEHYTRGGLGDMTLKKLLIEDLKEFVLPIANQREVYTDDYLKEVLSHGNLFVKQKAIENMEKIKDIVFQ
jgi:tryptophanyl-tRNA synthetase